MFEAAVNAALPEHCVPPHLPPRPKGRTIVVGAGKAAAAMAAAVEKHWGGELEGLVITRYGHGVPCRKIEVVEASHPVPDEAGERAGRRILELVKNLSPDDMVLCLISGGGSALLSVPLPGITLAHKQAITADLLKSGATIHEINCVRKQLSAVKGGRLAAAAQPAQVVSLIISDVPNDDLSVIASGPTVSNRDTANEAAEVLRKYAIKVPAEVSALLSEAARNPNPVGHPASSAVVNKLIAAPQQSLMAAAAVAKEAGFESLILGDSLEGEARDVGLVHAGIARQCLRSRQPIAAPCVLISGGETTVTVRGNGRGGRNTEFLLALAIALDGHKAISAVAGDTDGIDGQGDNAGAFLLPDTLNRAIEVQVNPRQCLANNDAYSVFEASGDLLISGPTFTNVNDFRAILIEAA
jgi:hydroxypyruvate reductase